jgi:hypothetical protein
MNKNEEKKKHFFVKPLFFLLLIQGGIDQTCKHTSRARKPISKKALRYGWQGGSRPDQ